MEQINKIIGEHIKLVRIKHKKSRGDVADAVKLSQQQIQKYELGTNRISLEKAYQIADYLKVDIVDLIPNELRKCLN